MMLADGVIELHYAYRVESRRVLHRSFGFCMITSSAPIKPYDYGEIESLSSMPFVPALEHCNRKISASASVSSADDCTAYMDIVGLTDADNSFQTIVRSK